LSAEQVRGSRIDHVLQTAGLVKSRGEGRRLVTSGGVYIATRAQGGEQIEFTAVSTPESVVDEYLLDGKLLVLRLGKWKIKVIELTYR